MATTSGRADRDQQGFNSNKSGSLAGTGGVDRRGDNRPSYVYPSFFTVNVTGLKPFTKHTFRFDNVDKTSSCKQIADRNCTYSVGGALGILPVAAGAGIVTDQSGQCKFNIYFKDMLGFRDAWDHMNNKKFELIAVNSYAALNTAIVTKKV